MINQWGIGLQESCPRVVSLGDNPGCPCGGTHVYDIKQIGHINVSFSPLLPFFAINVSPDGWIFFWVSGSAFL